jgi:glycosyltransferase involved in cell wall biosynthesis
MTPGTRPLFVLPDLSAGGAEQTTLRLAGDLARRGAVPSLFLLRHRGEFLDRVPAGVRVRGALEDGASIHTHAPRILRALLREAAASDVVVGALEHEAAYFAWACARLGRRPAIGWIHAVMGEHLRELAPIHTRLARIIYPRFDRIVFPSHGAADSLARVARLTAARIEVIPSHLDPDALRTQADAPLPDWARPVFARPTVVAIGRLVPSKGGDTLLRAHARLRGQGGAHHLLIVGEGPERASLEALAASLGVRDSVFMPGYVANPLPLLKAAQVFALASRFEGLSLVLQEALVVGTAIVATDCPGGPATVLDGGRCGVLVPRDSPDALAHAIVKLLREPDLRATLVAAGRVRAEAFTAARVVPQWERLLAATAAGAG